MPSYDEFEKDPFAYLDRELPHAGAWIQLDENQFCLTEAAPSRAVLTNADGLFAEHSDFFHTRRGNFGPRELQVELGRSAMKVLYAQLQARAAALPELVARQLEPSSEWPDAGNWLIYRHLAPALIAPRRPARLHALTGRIVERAVLAGARWRYNVLSRAIFRYRALRALAAAIEESRRRPPAEPEDLLDVLAAGARPELARREVPAAELAEVFLSFLFAVSGSVGFTLAWSLYLMGRHPERAAAPPGWVVREALRLEPVAWLLGRQPARPHELAGRGLRGSDQVAVCPYAVHRNPRHWEQPAEFRPERWQHETEPEAFIPFGAGPHKCVGASFSLRLVEDVLRIVTSGWQMRFAPHGERPQIGAALAPPRFTLGLERR